MTTYRTTLAAREDIAVGTVAFHLRKPPGFAFRPGQAIDLVLPAPVDGADAGAAAHAFSIVSAPFEDELVIATRMRDSAFKRALAALPLGAPVQVEGPMGSLGLPRDRTRAAVLVAGGIGITPFVSMLRQAAHDALAQRLVLLYSNRRPEDAAFLVELQRLADRHPDFRLVATMTDMAHSTRRWDGPTGPIDADLVRRAVGALPAPVFYVVGPPGMVEAMRDVLAAAGADADDIRSEAFYGY